ncbi:MAG TPA: DinB family protein [Thermoanaerobaculia bacterium]|jgi:hypothetical protein
MYKAALTALLALCAFAAFAGEPMTEAEKTALIAHLERTSASFEKSIEGVTDAQWSYKASPQRWSLAECSEHVVSAESFIRNLFAPSMKEPASAEVLEGARKEQVIEAALLDRSKKFQAPEPLVPSATKFASPAEAIAAFRAERQKTIELARQSGDLRSFAMAHPVGGPLDAYGWFTFLSAHTARHTLQIEEVKADANYPR